MKKKMLYLSLLCGLLLCATASNLYAIWPFSVSGEIETYKFEVCSLEEVKNITLYLPFPHYRGKFQQKLFKQLKKNFDAGIMNEKNGAIGELNKHKDSLKRGVIIGMGQNMDSVSYIPILEKNIQIYSNVQLSQIDTKYGKMLKLYIPFLGGPGAYSTDLLNGEVTVRIHANIKTVVDDYKLTYEENLIPTKREEIPNTRKLVELPAIGETSNWLSKKEIEEAHRYYGDPRIEAEYNIPIYAEFEGKELYVKLYGCVEYIYWEILSHPGGDYFLSYEVRKETVPWSKDKKMLRLDNSGWQEKPLIKRKIWEKWSGQKKIPC